jgi:hypothetical protein
MLADGQDIEVRRSDLQSAVWPLPEGRRKPHRFALARVVTLRAADGRLILVTKSLQASVEFSGVWRGELAVDAWRLRTTVLRLPAEPTIRLVGIGGRLAIVALHFRSVLPAIAVIDGVVLRRFLPRLDPRPPDDLPLFRRRLL